MTFARFVVIRQCAVKRILPGREIHWYVIMAPRRLRIVIAAVVFRPGCVPAAGMVRHGIIRGRIFANPEYGGNDFRFPWETFAALHWIAEVTRRRVADGIDLEQYVLSKTVLFLV